MTPQRQRALHRALVAAGVGVLIASLLAFRWADWPIYLAYFALALILYPPVVEVMPRLVIGIPSVAAGVGFLYIGGLPIIALNLLAVTCIRVSRSAIPSQWLAGVPALRALVARRDLAGGGAQSLAQFVPESATYAVGLAA